MAGQTPVNLLSLFSQVQHGLCFRELSGRAANASPSRGVVVLACSKASSRGLE